MTYDELSGLREGPFGAYAHAVPRPSTRPQPSVGGTGPIVIANLKTLYPGKNQKQIAVAIEKSQATLSKWARDRRHPDPKELHEVARLTGRTYQWLTTRHETVPARDESDRAGPPVPTDPTRAAEPQDMSEHRHRATLKEYVARLTEDEAHELLQWALNHIGTGPAGGKGHRGGLQGPDNHGHAPPGHKARR